MIIFSVSGILVFLLGVLNRVPLLIAVFFQPMVIGAFFPIANTAISVITPHKTRNVAFSIVIPLAGSIGAGVTPSFIGWLGEVGSFGTGFLILGSITMASLVLLFFLRIARPDES
jgi:NNP family nitrate/nitrite transporter-like MFS transporter